MTLAERFNSKVKKTKTCWNWIGGKGCSFGYGAISVNSKPLLTHRVAWFLEYGVMPKLFVLHKCDNPRCVRPSHLFLGTQKDNNIDRKNKKRSKPIFGENHFRSKFSTIQIQEIRQLYATGFWAQSLLAYKFKVTRQCINYIVNNKTNQK